ncbi:MAG: hypothetical protein AB1Y36_00555 [Cycloclasticus sp.]
MKLSLFELISLSTQLHSQLYEHWAVFISLHLALLGGLFAFDLNIKTSFKISFLLFYGLFAGINLAVSINLLNQIAAIVSDLNTLGAEQSQLAAYLQQEDLAYSRPVLIFTHLLTGLMVLLGLFIPSKK